MSCAKYLPGSRRFASSPVSLDQRSVSLPPRSLFHHQLIVNGSVEVTLDHFESIKHNYKSFLPILISFFVLFVCLDVPPPLPIYNLDITTLWNCLALVANHKETFAQDCHSCFPFGFWGKEPCRTGLRVIISQALPDVRCLGRALSDLYLSA